MKIDYSIPSRNALCADMFFGGIIGTLLAVGLYLLVVAL